MTVSAQTPYSSQAANGVTTAFPFPYKIRSNSDIVVTLVDANAVETVQTLGVHYTVSGAGGSGGTVTFLAAPANGLTVKTRRVTTLARSIDYQNNGDLLAGTINNDVDAAWLALQELASGTQPPVNSVHAPTGETLTQLAVAAQRADRALVFDASGQPSMSSFTQTQAASAIAALNSLAVAPGGVFTQAGTGAVPRSTQDKQREVVSVEDFGAAGNGTATTGTDDSAAFQRAIDAVFALGGGRVRAFGRYRISANVTVKPGVALEGNWSNVPGEMITEGDNYDGLRSVLFIASTATFTFLDSSGVSGFVAIRFGLDLPFADAAAATAGIAAFAGTAFTVGGQDVTLRMLLVLGFSRAINSSGWERVRCEWVSGDCNNGIRIDTSPDTSYVNKCHFWPFTTGHQTWITNSLLQRSGVAFAFSGINDWTRVTDCFSYGYLRGFQATDVSSFTFIGCSADNTSSAGRGRLCRLRRVPHRRQLG
jgi:hypothetical protein